MTKCCSEFNCRRQHPVRIRRGALSGKWMAITRYRWARGDHLVSVEKHQLPPEDQVEIEIGSSVLKDLHRYVLDQFAATEDHSEVHDAYRDVLDQLHGLIEKTKDDLLNPPQDDQERPLTWLSAGVGPGYS